MIEEIVNTIPNQIVSNKYFFRLKRHENQFNMYVDKLGIRTDGEKFVLHHILSRDWNRDLILISIETIKFSDIGYSGLVHVKCRTRNSCYDFSVSHLGGYGWSVNTTIEQQKRYISGDLYHKMD